MVRKVLTGAVVAAFLAAVRPIGAGGEREGEAWEGRRGFWRP